MTFPINLERAEPAIADASISLASEFKRHGVLFPLWFWLAAPAAFSMKPLRTPRSILSALIPQNKHNHKHNAIMWEICNRNKGKIAKYAHVANVSVEGSNPFARSNPPVASHPAKLRQTAPFTGSSACSFPSLDATG